MKICYYYIIVLEHSDFNATPSGAQLTFIQKLKKLVSEQKNKWIDWTKRIGNTR